MTRVRILAAAFFVLVWVRPASAQFVQQGPKLVDVGTVSQGGAARRSHIALQDWPSPFPLPRGES
jgi:hypothetical protein